MRGGRGVRVTMISTSSPRCGDCCGDCCGGSNGSSHGGLARGTRGGNRGGTRAGTRAGGLCGGSFGDSLGARTGNSHGEIAGGTRTGTCGHSCGGSCGDSFGDCCGGSYFSRLRRARGVWGCGGGSVAVAARPPRQRCVLFSLSFVRFSHFCSPTLTIRPSLPPSPGTAPPSHAFEREPQLAARAPRPQVRPRHVPPPPPLPLAPSPPLHKLRLDHRHPLNVTGWKINTQGYAGGPAKILLFGGVAFHPTLTVQEHASLRICECPHLQESLMQRRRRWGSG